MGRIICPLVGYKLATLQNFRRKHPSYRNLRKLSQSISSSDFLSENRYPSTAKEKLPQPFKEEYYKTLQECEKIFNGKSNCEMLLYMPVSERIASRSQGHSHSWFPGDADCTKEHCSPLSTSLNYSRNEKAAGSLMGRSHIKRPNSGSVLGDNSKPSTSLVNRSCPSNNHSSNDCFEIDDDMIAAILKSDDDFVESLSTSRQHNVNSSNYASIVQPTLTMNGQHSTSMALRKFQRGETFSQEVTYFLRSVNCTEGPIMLSVKKFEEFLISKIIEASKSSTSNVKHVVKRLLQEKTKIAAKMIGIELDRDITLAFAFQYIKMFWYGSGLKNCRNLDSNYFFKRSAYWDDLKSLASNGLFIKEISWNVIKSEFEIWPSESAPQMNIETIPEKFELDNNQQITDSLNSLSQFNKIIDVNFKAPEGNCSISLASDSFLPGMSELLGNKSHFDQNSCWQENQTELSASLKKLKCLDYFLDNFDMIKSFYHSRSQLLTKSHWRSFEGPLSEIATSMENLMSDHEGYIKRAAHVPKNKIDPHLIDFCSSKGSIYNYW